VHQCSGIPKTVYRHWRRKGEYRRGV